MVLKTDFDKISELYLVYPEEVIGGSRYVKDDYSGLAVFYDELIRYVPETIEIRLFVKSRRVAEKVKQLRGNLDTFVNSNLRDIWIRDWSGFTDGQKLFKPIYHPKYFRSEYHIADSINQTAYSLHSFMEVDNEDLGLILDGGNFVHNGELAIITKRILGDNKKIGNEAKIRRIMEETLGIKVVFVDEMEGDDTGHSDGCFAFLSPKDLIISKYPNNWKVEQNIEYLEKCTEEFKNKGINVHRLEETPQIRKSKKEFSSAKGIYVNFLKLNDLIIMPVYKGLNTENERHNKEVLGKFGKIVTIDCTGLSEFGGVLHCISFTN